MGRRVRQASSGRALLDWHRINGRACHRRVRSLQRRSVQAVQAGAWRTVTRLSYLLVHSCAARALAVKRVTETTGSKTPGVDGDLWDTPEKKESAVAPIGRGQGDRPAPLKRSSIPQKNGQQRPLSMPTLGDRARQAAYLQALPPIAETTGAPHAYGCRPKRRGAEAIDHCFTVLQQKTAAAWILAGDIHGCFENLRFSGREHHIPMPKRGLSKGLRSGFVDHGARFPTTAGGPHGGICSPVISNRVWDGLEAMVQGGHGHRRGHHINDGRWADDFSVTANWRQVLEETVLPRISAFLATRGVRRSPTKTVLTQIAQGFDFLGQPLRKHARPQGNPATRQMTPRQASVQALQARVKALWKQRAGSTPAQLIGPLTPILRGGANDHRPVICGATFAPLESFV